MVVLNIANNKITITMNTSNDKEQLHRLFENMAVAWGKGDGELYASFFTENCDYITFYGEHLKGRQSIAKTHQKLYESFLMRDSKLNQQIKNIRFLTPDIAIVHVVGAVKLRFQKQAPKSRLSINTNVAIKQNGEWKISAFHNCRIQPPGLLEKLMT